MSELSFIEATFAPKREDDLRPEAAALVGRRIQWRPMGTMDSGPYEGQRIYMPRDFAVNIGWVPFCDLKDVQEVE